VGEVPFGLIGDNMDDLRGKLGRLFDIF